MRSKYITIKMTREEAQKMGLLSCGNCGWPENNHFDFDERPCANDPECKGYRETARVGKLLNKRDKAR